MAAKTRSILLIARTASAAFLISICTQSHSQSARWSLDPLVAPFPCSAVKLEGNSMVFLKTMVIVCNGNPIEEMPAGSFLGINIMCHGSGAIEHHGFDERGGLFDVARRSCSRIGTTRAQNPEVTSFEAHVTGATATAMVQTSLPRFTISRLSLGPI